VDKVMTRKQKQAPFSLSFCIFIITYCSCVTDSSAKCILDRKCTKWQITHFIAEGSAV